jgi:glycosyltransferase EpsD
VGYKEDIKPYLALADVVVSGAKQEGLPVNVMEAHAWGIPTVVTNIRGHVDLTHEATLGVLVDFEVESMADGMAFVLDHLQEFSPSLAPRFSEAAVVAHVNDIYQEVLQMEAVR